MMKGSKGEAKHVAGEIAHLEAPPHLSPPSTGPIFNKDNFVGNLDEDVNSQNAVVLKIEYLSDREAKTDFRLLRLGLVACTALLAVQCVWQYSSETKQLSGTYKEIYLNLVISTIIAVGVLVIGGLFIRRIVQTNKTGKIWTIRRKRPCILVSIDLASVFISMIFYMAPSIYCLIVQCGWVLAPVRLMGYLRWLALGVFMSNQVLQALLLVPVERFVPLLRRWKLITEKEEGRVDGATALRMGVDLPSRVYIILFFVLFAPHAVLLTFLFLLELGVFNNNVAFCTNIHDSRCFPQDQVFPNGVTEDCSTWGLDCELSAAEQGLTIAIAIWILLALPIYFIMLFWSRKQLHRLPYSEYRTSLLELGVQIRTRLLVAMFLFLSFVLLWLVSFNRCISNKMSWLGMAPVELATAILVAVSLRIHTPCSPESSQVKLQVWLRDVAWLEADIPRKLAARPFSGEPCFCFETILKLHYFCSLIYDIDEVPDSPFELSTALGLYGLTNHDLFWNEKLDAKSLVAWDDVSGLIVLAFRGTASVANVLADLQAWRSAHPPQRGSYWLGTMPLVHTGFLVTWIESGLQKQVMDLLRSIMATPPKGGSGRWRVVFTGHSLGGAVAKLAALDIAKASKNLAPGSDGIDISYVTFGCPYMGNKAFASELVHFVPDGWDVVLPDDIVATTGQFVFLYKRAGKRVLLSLKTGDLVVGPTYLERTILQGTHPSVQEHLLSTYASALAAVMRAQFGAKELEGARQGLAKLWESEYVREMLDHAGMGLRQESIKMLQEMAAPSRSASFITRASSRIHRQSTLASMRDVDVHSATGELLSQRISLRHLKSREEGAVDEEASLC